MSHLKERKEKTCLNCNADLIDRYCHHCGQENLEPKETVWHLVQHFFNDVTHFDGKFFSSVKYLMRRPGFLSKEYMNGRRASYLNPIRMYVFSSAIFFLLLFSLKKPEEVVNINTEERVHSPEKGTTYRDLLKERESVEQKLLKTTADDQEELESKKVTIGLELARIKKEYGDTTTKVFSRKELKAILAQATIDTVLASMGKGDKKDSPAVALRNGDRPALARDISKDTGAGYRYHMSDHTDTGIVKVSKQHDPALSGHKKGTDTVDLDQRIANKIGHKIKEKAEEEGDGHFVNFRISDYNTLEQYDSAQKKLPASERDGWFSRQIEEKKIVAQEEYRLDPDGYVKHFVEHMLHSIPKILFVSLPFFAMILNILYFRHKKIFYYVSHGIFAIHVYIATFILSAIILLLNKLYDAVSQGWLHVLIGLIMFVIVLYMLIYLYKAMRGFYGQGRFKTFVKYFITCWAAFIVNTILLVIFILLSVISI